MDWTTLCLLVIIGLVILWATSRRKPQPPEQPDTGFALGLTAEKGERFSFPEPMRETSMWVIGQPGSGKSRAIETWAMQDIIAGRGVTILDPAGDVFDHLLLRIAASPEREAIAKRLIIIDPTNDKWTTGFNPLERQKEIPDERLSRFFTDILIKVWKIDPTSAPRMVRLLGFTFLALLDLNLTMMDLPKFLIDSDYRNAQIPKCKNEEVKLYFEKEYPKSEGAIQQWSGPVLNKIGEFIFDPDIRLMLTTKATINFRQIMDEQKIVLVNLSKGKIGEGASSMLGAFIVANVQKAALSRADTTHRPRMYLYLDEFQNFTTDNIKDILAESRKYGLSLILSHQYLKQLTDPNLKAAVQNTTGTIIAFSIGYEDGSTVSHEMFPHDAMISNPRDYSSFAKAFAYGAVDSLNKTTYKREPMNAQELVALLTDQPKATFWMRQRRQAKPQHLKVFNMPDPFINDEILKARQEMVDASMSRYGRLKSEARAERKAQGATGDQSANKSDDDEPFYDDKTTSAL